MQSRWQLMQVKKFMLRYNAGMAKDSKELVRQLATRLLKQRQKLCTAESCTGGLIAKTLTDLAGSSDWFERGFVTYSNQAKNEMLAVPASVIEDYGAVSEPVAAAMAIGALRHSHADFSVAVTGVAGPGGGSEEKPVGTVWIAVASADQNIARRFQFSGDREAVRVAALVAALEALIDLVDSD
jgi:nicotinamide-nucleotide amidase